MTSLNKFHQPNEERKMKKLARQKNSAGNESLEASHRNAQKACRGYWSESSKSS